MANALLNFLANLLRESPVLFLVLVVNISIISYLLGYFVFYLMKKKHPEKSVSFFLWKMLASRKESDIKTIEDVYNSVIESLVKKGILSDGDGRGVKARSKALVGLEGKKREIVNQLFNIYERKVYGDKVIQNEAGTASKILSMYLNS